VSIIYLLLNYNKHDKFNMMPPKVVVLLSAAIISGRNDTSIMEDLNTNS